LKKNKFIAFTLAEVLITLGIIGIVAQMTIPTLTKSVQQQQYITRLKNVYSEMNQALLMMSLDSGCTGKLDCFYDSNNDIVMGDKIASYFKIAKNCKINSGINEWNGYPGGCGDESIKPNYDGSGTPITGMAGYRFITVSGYTIILWGAPTVGCGVTYDKGPMSSGCQVIVIDTNGPGNPNTFGLDVFEFFITDGKGPQIYPLGGQYYNFRRWNPEGWCTESNKSGASCGGRIMEEGWQMNY